MKLDNVIAVRDYKKVYREEDKVIKLFKEGYSKSNILNEALNHSRAEETGLSIPRLLEVSMINGKWAIITEFIEGKTLAQLMKENPNKKSEYLNRFVDIQIKINSKKSPLLNKLHDKMNRKISEANLDATTRYDLHTRLKAMPNHDKICHGDFNPTNIIITGDNKEYILDWAHVTQGNASFDAATTYLLFCISGDTEIAEEYLNIFCQKSDTARQYVQKWLPITAASQLSKKSNKEKEFLLKWVDVVDYQ